MKTRANVLPGKYIFGTRYPPFPSAPANVVLSDIAGGATSNLISLGKCLIGAFREVDILNSKF